MSRNWPYLSFTQNAFIVAPKGRKVACADSSGAVMLICKSGYIRSLFSGYRTQYARMRKRTSVSLPKSVALAKAAVATRVVTVLMNIVRTRSTKVLRVVQTPAAGYICKARFTRSHDGVLRSLVVVGRLGYASANMIGGSADRLDDEQSGHVLMMNVVRSEGAMRCW